MLSTYTQPSASHTTSGPVEIVFGYQGPECLSRGICRMETPLEMAKISSHLKCATASIKATLHYYRMIDHLNLSIELSAIDHLTWRNQFSDGSLQLNRHFLLSKSVCRMLGIPRTAVIPSNSYPFEVVANRIEIVMPVVVKAANSSVKRKVTAASVA